MNKNYSFKFLFLLYLGLQLNLTGCVSDSHQLMMKTEKQIDEQAIVTNVATKLDLLETRVAKARASGISLLGNDDMNEALDALAEARRYHSRFLRNSTGVKSSTSLLFGQPTGEKALSLIAQANTALLRAENNKRDSDAILKEFTENMEWLKKFEAPFYFPSEYSEIEKAHSKLLAQIAKGRTDKAVKQLPLFLREQKALEIVSAQQHYLKVMSRKIEEASNGNISRYAEQSFHKCVAAYNRASLTIAINPRDDKAIADATQDIEQALSIAHSIAQDMQRLAGMDQLQMERWLLLLTTQLQLAGIELGGADLSQLSVLEQAETLANLAREGHVVAATPKQDVDLNTNQKEELADKATTEAEKPTHLSKTEISLIEKMDNLNAQLQAMKVQNQTASAELPLDLNFKTKSKTNGKRRSLFVR
ncbi:MAG: hypothetical protein KUG82_09735 [Pseudomonadales bacterium]|nr:hypothetical protein [Pseudomonadales bacterium]